MHPLRIGLLLLSLALPSLLPLLLASCPGPGPGPGPKGSRPTPASRPAQRVVVTAPPPQSAPASAASKPTNAIAPRVAPTTTPARVRPPLLPAGSLSRAAVQRIIRAEVPAVRRCYEAELARQPKAAGQLLLSMVVQADGSVREVVVEYSTIVSPLLDACVVSRVSRWRFPPPRGGLVVIKYPLVFRPAP